MAACLPNTGVATVRLSLAIYNCNIQLINSITDNDVQTMDNLSILTNADVETLAKTLSSLPNW